MKKQYIGDEKDLFKYDLIKCILEQMDHPTKQFTFITMLTENDDSGQGGTRNFESAEKRGRPGTNNDKLIKALKKYRNQKPEERNFLEIKRYFKEEGIEIKLCQNKFRPKSRDKYFRKILENKGFLCNPLVFIDPDIGLGTKDKESNKEYLTYNDVRKLYKEIHEDSIFMIFQHFSYYFNIKKKVKATKKRCTNLKDELDLHYFPPYILGGSISFLFLTRKITQRKKLGKILSEYKKRYRKFPNIRVGNITCKYDNVYD